MAGRVPPATQRDSSPPTEGGTEREIVRDLRAQQCTTYQLMPRTIDTTLRVILHTYNQEIQKFPWLFWLDFLGVGRSTEQRLPVSYKRTL